MAANRVSESPAKVPPRVTSGSIAARGSAVEAALSRSLFVIPSINGGLLLRRMLPTLRLRPDTVVVLDQGSVDDTEAVCRSAGIGFVQLGRPHTYTEASNIGARMAREAGCDFVFISNNDIAFTTDVGAELLAEMLDDPRLGIVAPSQVIIDEKLGERFLAYRAEWHLDTMLFTHDIRSVPDDVERLEADLCELTCAAIRMSAIEEIGFLDDAYGFYYEDADFCFRLRQAGYSCAYLPRSQIEHYTSSTFSAGMSARKRAYMAKNMDLFAHKHLGYAVGQLVAKSRRGDRPVDGKARHLPPYLQRFGLLDPGRPALVVDVPGTKPLDYLLVDTAILTDTAPRLLAAYHGLVATSEWGRGQLVDAGFEDVGLAPLGVETDLFHPWAAAARPFAETTFLWRGRGDAGLATLLEAWAQFRADRPESRLLAIGTDLLDAVRHAPAGLRLWQGSVIAEYPSDGVTLRELSGPLADEDWVRIYRGVDVVLSTDPYTDADPAGALACGTLVIAPTVGPAGDLVAAGGLGLAAAGCAGGWRPEVASLVLRLHEAYALGDAERRSLARTALPLIRSRHTWRSTCAGLQAALAAWQEPRDMRDALRRRREAEATEDPYEARETAEEPDEAPEGAVAGEPMPVGRSAAASAPTALPIPGGAQAGFTLGPNERRPAHIVVRQIGRVRAARRSLIVVRRTQGRRAIVQMIRHALSRRAKHVLRWLLFDRRG